METKTFCVIIAFQCLLATVVLTTSVGEIFNSDFFVQPQLQHQLTNLNEMAHNNCKHDINNKTKNSPNWQMSCLRQHKPESRECETFMRDSFVCCQLKPYMWLYSFLLFSSAPALSFNFLSWLPLLLSPPFQNSCFSLTEMISFTIQANKWL